MNCVCLQRVQACTECGNVARRMLVLELVFCMGAGAGTYSR